MRFRVPIEYRAIISLVTGILCIGVVFYHFVEGLSWINALYFCVVTLGTVGYGDITPQTNAGKMFTVLYIIVGIGILVQFGSLIASKALQHRVVREEKKQQTKV